MRRRTFYILYTNKQIIDLYCLCVWATIHNEQCRYILDGNRFVERFKHFVLDFFFCILVYNKTTRKKLVYLIPKCIYIYSFVYLNVISCVPVASGSVVFVGKYSFTRGASAHGLSPNRSNNEPTNLIYYYTNRNLEKQVAFERCYSTGTYSDRQRQLDGMAIRL